MVDPFYLGFSYSLFPNTCYSYFFSVCSAASVLSVVNPFCLSFRFYYSLSSAIHVFSLCSATSVLSVVDPFCLSFGFYYSLSSALHVFSLCSATSVPSVVNPFCLSFSFYYSLSSAIHIFCGRSLLSWFSDCFFWILCRKY